MTDGTDHENIPIYLHPGEDAELDYTVCFFHCLKKIHRKSIFKGVGHAESVKIMMTEDTQSSMLTFHMSIYLRNNNNGMVFQFIK